MICGFLPRGSSDGSQSYFLLAIPAGIARADTMGFLDRIDTAKV
jgi:hypothetical protein